MNATMESLNQEVRAARVELDRTHEVWMNTSIFAPAEPAPALEAKEAAERRWTAALAARGQAGGRAYPTWEEISLPALPTF